jgi:hypothetical protein
MCERDAETAALRAEVSRLQGALIDGVRRLVEEGNAKIPKQFRTFESPDQIGDAFRFAEAEVERLTGEPDERRRHRAHAISQAIGIEDESTTKQCAAIRVLRSRSETAEARVAVLEGAVLCALNHAGQCLCCRRWYEDSQDAATRSTAQHDEDCYISVCRAALKEVTG